MAVIIGSCSKSNQSDESDHLRPRSDSATKSQAPNTDPGFALTGPTPCITQTAPTGDPETQKMRDAFTLPFLKRICGKDPVKAKPWRSAAPGPGSPSGWRADKYNPDSWIADLNLTGLSGFGGPRGIAVTRRHLLCTSHGGYFPRVGQTVYFLTRDNQVVSRKAIATVVLQKNGWDIDITVIRLDSDLPESITPFTVLAPGGNTFIQRYTPVLRIDTEEKALIGAVYDFGTMGIETDPVRNPGGEAMLMFQESMILYDSSSPSFLLYETDTGVTPIFISMVADPGAGDGPFIYEYMNGIKEAIQGFGDAHEMTMILRGPDAPSCTISGVRLGTTGLCQFSIIAGSTARLSRDPLFYHDVKSWSAFGPKVYVGVATCPSTALMNYFKSQLTSIVGVGPTCVSPPFSEFPVLPGCALTAARVGYTETCAVTVTPTIGAVAGSPALTPPPNAAWQTVGSQFKSTAFCSQSASTKFTASLSGPVGTGPACVSTVGAINTLEMPVCRVAATRVGFSDKCDIRVSLVSGQSAGNPKLSPSALTDWIASGAVFKAQGPCETNTTTRFSASIPGPAGAGPSCASLDVPAIPADVPTCRVVASRKGYTRKCSIDVTILSGVPSGNPNLAPVASDPWIASGMNYSTSSICPIAATTTFTAEIPGPTGQGSPCASNGVAPIPAEAPICAVSATRIPGTQQCDVVVTLTTGTATGNPTLGPGPLIPWTLSGNAYRTKASCPLGTATRYLASLPGIAGNGPACNSADVLPE